MKPNIQYHYDNDSEPPWEMSDGHGPVRFSSKPHRADTSNKRRGERPMNNAGRQEMQYYYDWQEACKLARKDGWNAEPYDAPNRVQRAVQADFDFLCGWVNGDWEYVGVVVTLGEHERSLWGVETYKNYHEQVAQELLLEIQQEIVREAADLETAYAGL